MLTFDRNMIFRINEEDKKNVLIFLAEKLGKKGYVKHSYINAILKRESKYPTGIQAGKLGVAIPHTDAEHVIKNGIAVGILEKPVQFQRIDNPDVAINVNFIIMLALKQAHGQIDVLQNITNFIVQEKVIQNILNDNNLDHVYNIISKNL